VFKQTWEVKKEIGVLLELTGNAYVFPEQRSRTSCVSLCLL